jgi:hypothetical protein
MYLAVVYINRRCAVVTGARPEDVVKRVNRNYPDADAVDFYKTEKVTVIKKTTSQYVLVD